MKEFKQVRDYLSLILLFLPPLLFVCLFCIFRNARSLQFSVFPWQFIILGISGIVATTGGVLDWRFHRDPLNLKLPKKERDAEAAALGLGGLPMFILMWFAMLSEKPLWYLIPICVVLIYTVVLICYDEFIFHRKRCGKRETTYHRMLVFGNAIAWLSWLHYIYL